MHCAPATRRSTSGAAGLWRTGRFIPGSGRAVWCSRTRKMASGIDTGVHTLMTLTMAAMLSPEVDVRFATLCHDLGKGLTPKSCGRAIMAMARQA